LRRSRELDCTDILEEISPEPGDIVVEKFGYGAFHGTPLAGVLREAGVESLVVTGTVTQICVEETAREAFHHGFPTTLQRVRTTTRGRESRVRTEPHPVLKERAPRRQKFQPKHAAHPAVPDLADLPRQPRPGPGRPRFLNPHPNGRPTEPPERGPVIPIPEVGGLPHRDVRRAA
jgi:hypothetical protein